jgi:hypothetical protein
MGNLLSLRYARVVTRQSAMRTGWFAPQVVLAPPLAPLVFPIPAARLGVRATFHVVRKSPGPSRAVRASTISGFDATASYYANM